MECLQKFFINLLHNLKKLRIEQKFTYQHIKRYFI